MKHYKPLRCLIGLHRWLRDSVGEFCERCGKDRPTPTAVSR